MISVILPTYENAEAVQCALAGLRRQTLRDFEIVLIDDSESNDVKDAVYFDSDVYYIRSSPPRVGRFTAGRARNIGAANAREKLLVFIDQDVILAPDALAYYQDAYARHGDNTVIVGLYHWMPRMEFSHKDIRTLWDEIRLNALPTLPMDEPGMQGPDIRTKDFTDDINHIVDDAALGAWSGNIGYPRSLFIELGGFDEDIRGHGGEDADLGLTAKTHGAKYLLYRKIWGLHRWHSRDQKRNAKEVQANIEYIDKKHGIGKYADAKRFGVDAQDWRDARHYKKEVGGVLMQIEGRPTIWVARGGRRLGLPEPQWITTLGFTPGDVLMLPPGGLDKYEVVGVAGVESDG